MQKACSVNNMGDGFCLAVNVYSKMGFLLPFFWCLLIRLDGVYMFALFVLRTCYVLYVRVSVGGGLLAREMNERCIIK